MIVRVPLSMKGGGEDANSVLGEQRCDRRNVVLGQADRDGWREERGGVVHLLWRQMG